MKKTNPTEKTYNYIIEKIKTKEWMPNSKIMTENELSNELNVSRVAVREAIQNLVGLGLLKKQQGAGTYVNDIGVSTYMNSLIPLLLLNDTDIINILEFRIYFEYGNVRMFMKNYNEEDIQKLEYHFEEMKKSVNDHEKFGLEDFNFHNVIVRGTRNPIVIKISEILYDILKGHQSILYTKVGPQIGLDYHKDILKAIKSDDAKIAALYMRRHIEYTIEQYKGLR